MNLVVNGERVEVSADASPGSAGDHLSVRDLLVKLGYGETLVAVERNAEVVPRSTHASARLKDGDIIEIVHFVGGG